MNPIRLQKMIVLALHDPTFQNHLDQSFSAVRTTMKERIGCTEDEWTALQSVDSRLFKSDALRGDRLLTGLCDRFPISLWSVLSPNLFVSLRSFLSSKEFYSVVLDDGYLHQGFAAFLGRVFPQHSAMIDLELALEDVSSTAQSFEPIAADVCIHPYIRLLHLPTGFLEHFLNARTMLQRTASSGASFLLDPSREPLDGPPFYESVNTEPVLVEPGIPVQIGGLNQSLATVLEYVKVPRSKEAVVGMLIQEGADAHECEALLQQFHSECWIMGQIFSPMR